MADIKVLLASEADPMTSDESFAFWMYASAAIICCITVCVFVYIEVIVIKKVGASDKVIPMMLLMLQFSAISKFDKKVFTLLYMVINPSIIFVLSR